MSHKAALDGWSRLRIARARGVLVVVSRTAGAERGAAPSIPSHPTPAPQPAAAPRLDPDRFKLLKRPLEGRSDVFGRGEPTAPRWQK